MQWKVTPEEEGTDARFDNMHSESQHYENSVKEGKWKRIKGRPSEPPPLHFYLESIISAKSHRATVCCL